MNIKDPTFLDSAEFREVTELTEAEQRTLLHASEPRVRVWAAWALGLRLSDGISAELRDSIADEPVAGVRRHLLVMLAGFGEVDIVAALARHDPDDYVRKTAARFVGELSVNHPDAFAIAAQMLADADPAIRAAIIDGLPADVPPEIATLLADARDDESELVREAITRRDAGALDIDALRTTATREPNSVVRRGALKALVDRVGVAAALQPLPQTQRKRALSDLKAARVSVRFDEIADLRPGAAFLDLIELDGLGRSGRMWLLSLSPNLVPDYWRRVAAAYGGVTIDSDEERDAVRQFVEGLEDSLRAGTAEHDETGALMPWGEWAPWETARRGLLDLLCEKLRSDAR